MARSCSFVAVVLLTACGHTAKHGTSTGVGGTASGGSAATGGSVTEEPCIGLEEPPDVPARLLNDYERNNVLEPFGESFDRFPPTPRQSRLFLEEQPIPASGVFVEQMFLWAEETARKLTTDGPRLAQLIGCDAVVDGEEVCREALNRFVITRLFRGLASEETGAELDQVFDRGQELDGDYAGGVRAVLEVALQSPELHYRIEFGRPSAQKGDGWAEATDFELASRLSFLFWERGPDEELLSAAERGLLAQGADIEAQARRLLADERARPAVRRFYRELLGALNPYQIDSSAFPDFSVAIPPLVSGEFDAFVDEATFGAPGDFRALFAPVTWLNAPLAAFYGLPGVSGDAFQRVELDPQRYAGLLTLPAWLNRAPSGFSHPSVRGAAVSRGLLCIEIPPEPPDLNVTPPDPPAGALTSRQRLEVHASDPVCASCHSLMDPLGFALEHFDASGRWRDTEEGLPIDTTGEINVTDAAGPFDGAVQLSERIAGSQDARSCFVINWMRFAYGRHEADVNGCTRDALSARFAEANDNVVELLVGLTQTDSFRYLTPQEAQK